MINLEYSISNEEIVEASLNVPNFLELSKKIKVPYVSLMARIKEETDLEKEVIRNFQANRSDVVYNVMDTSLTGCKNPIDEVKTLISKGERIVIVSPVLKELTNNIKHFADLCASNSRNVMSMACADSENFENVLVEENPVKSRFLKKSDTDDDQIFADKQNESLQGRVAVAALLALSFAFHHFL